MVGSPIEAFTTLTAKLGIPDELVPIIFLSKCERVLQYHRSNIHSFIYLFAETLIDFFLSNLCSTSPG